jgi:thymidylate synthase (FAD)
VGQGDNDSNPVWRCPDCLAEIDWSPQNCDAHRATCDVRRGAVWRVRDVLGDGIAYVAMVDAMGDQWTPAEDARMSTGRGRLGPQKDAALQERLLKDAHTSPFEGVILKFELCVPLNVLREIDRHRTLSKISDEDVEVLTPDEASRKWFARNEMSGRYIQLPNEYYHPVVVRGQSKTNKQGDANVEPVPEHLQYYFREAGRKITEEARALYDWAVGVGIEKGLARIYNTQNQYTRIRMTGSLKNWFDFLYLRLPENVLWECRRVAEALLAIVEANYPDPVARWRRHVLESVRLTRDEVRVLKRFFIDLPDDGGTPMAWDDETRALLTSVKKKLEL